MIFKRSLKHLTATIIYILYTTIIVIKILLYNYVRQFPYDLEGGIQSLY